MDDPIIDIIDLIHVNGVENPSGVAQIHGFGNLEDIVVLQVPDDLDNPDATTESVASIAVSHTWAVGKSMKKLYGTENKGKVGYVAAGDIDSGSQKSTAELMYPGSRIEADAMARLFTSWKGIVWIQETDGTVRQIGSAKFQASIKVTYDTGNNESYRGYKLEISCYGPAVIYTPGLNFTPAIAGLTPPVFTFTPLANLAVGAADVTPVVTSTSGAAIVLTSSNPAVATIVAGKVHPVAAGVANIIASQLAAGGFAGGSSVQPITITA